MRPVVTSELLGRRNFGVVSGLVGLMHMGGYALGPSVSAMVWTWGGYDRVIVLAIVTAIRGDGCAARGLERRPTRRTVGLVIRARCPVALHGTPGDGLTPIGRHATRAPP